MAKRPIEGSLGHMLDSGCLPGHEWWRCGTCRQHPCDCECPTPLAVRVLDASDELAACWSWQADVVF